MEEEGGGGREGEGRNGGNEVGGEEDTFQYNITP